MKIVVYDMSAKVTNSFVFGTKYLNNYYARITEMNEKKMQIE